MADTTYMPKVYHRRPGDVLVVADGGEIVAEDGGGILVESGGSLTVDPGGSVVFPNPYGAQDYYVDGNASGETAGAGRVAYDLTVDGLSWATAFSQLTSAITASNASIVLNANRWWARRNRIFVCGDQEHTVNLTILPEKCDIIGVGFDLVPYPRINGTHIIAALATGKAYGTRFLNLGFQNNSANETFKFLQDHIGIEFYNCDLWPRPAGSTIAISLTTSNRSFKFINSRIKQESSIGGLFAEGIVINGASQMDMTIAHSYIYATEGIHAHAGIAAYNGLIQNNIIRATALTVNDVSGNFAVISNKLMTAATVNVAAGALGIVCNKILALDNKITGNAAGAENADYPFVDPLTS